jgi:hypothetical protein
MARSLMLCLLWLSSLCLLSGCYVAKGTKAMDIFTNCPVVYQPAVHNAKYTAQIDFFKKHFSGLFVFKSLNDSTQRVVFMNETGFKFFDFEFGSHHFTVQYIIPGLNKKIIVNTLRRDIGYLAQAPSENSAREQTKGDTYTLFKFPQGKAASYYYTDTKCNHLQKIESGSDGKKHITIDLSGSMKSNPETINLSDKNVRLTIFLRQITNE